MVYLLDTNILLRLLDAADQCHVEVVTAVSILQQRSDDLYIAVQNSAEFWNACTRPPTARGGLGLSVTEADNRLKLIEFMFPRVFDSPASYNHWRHLVVTCNVRGVQVHDARLAAVMLANRMSNILTINVADFARYPGIVAVSPADVVAAGP
jgi:predicted nucleic acid-binding protein